MPRYDRLASLETHVFEPEWPERKRDLNEEHVARSVVMGQDRELLEWKEAFDELEKERDEAVRKAQEKERSDMKDENDAVQIFIGKVLEENDALQDKVPVHILIAFIASRLCAWPSIFTYAPTRLATGISGGAACRLGGRAVPHD